MNEIITSASNSTIKQLRKLMTSGKEREEKALYVAEGIHLARSFITTGQTPVIYAYAASSLQNQEVVELLEKLSATTAKPIIIANTLFESISSIHASVGIIIVFSPLKASLDTILPLEDTTIVLEDVQDPGNLGTILRTAVASGIQNVILSAGCASPWSPKALRAGMGAQFGINIYEDAELAECVKTAEIPTYATTLAPGGQSLFTLDLRQPIVWMFGNEGRGVSEPLARLAKSSVYIPQEPSSIESLNVAAAVAVCLYEQYRQNIS